MSNRASYFFFFLLYISTLPLCPSDDSSSKELPTMTTMPSDEALLREILPSPHHVSVFALNQNLLGASPVIQSGQTLSETIEHTLDRDILAQLDAIPFGKHNRTKPIWHNNVIHNKSVENYESVGDFVRALFAYITNDADHINNMSKISRTFFCGLFSHECHSLADQIKLTFMKIEKISSRYPYYAHQGASVCLTHIQQLPTGKKVPFSYLVRAVLTFITNHYANSSLKEKVSKLVQFYFFFKTGGTPDESTLHRLRSDLKERSGARYPLKVFSRITHTLLRKASHWRNGQYGVPRTA